MASKALHYNEFGRRFHDFAVTIGFENVLTDVGQLLDMTPANFMRYLKGEREPKFATLQKIAATGCSIDYLLGNSDEMFSTNMQGVVLKTGVEARQFLETLHKLDSIQELNFLPKHVRNLYTPTARENEKSYFAIITNTVETCLSLRQKENQPVGNKPTNLSQDNFDSGDALFYLKQNLEKLYDDMSKYQLLAIFQVAWQNHKLQQKYFRLFTDTDGRNTVLVEFLEIQNSITFKLFPYIPLIEKCADALSQFCEVVQKTNHKLLQSLDEHGFAIGNLSKYPDDTEPNGIDLLLKRDRFLFTILEPVLGEIISTIKIFEAKEFYRIIVESKEYQIIQRHIEAMESIVGEFPRWQALESGASKATTNTNELTSAEIQILKELAARQMKQQ